MLKRCYSKNQQEAHPTYATCTVCEEWLTFSNFKSWMEKQDWEGKYLDKDILVIGNREYSASTCVFVSGLVNTFILECNKARGDWPIGVRLHKKSAVFHARCRNPFTGNSEYLGSFQDPQKAHEKWLSRKLELAHLLAAEQDDERIAKMLIERYTNYRELMD